MKTAYRIKRGSLIFKEEHEFHSLIQCIIWRLVMWKRGCKIIEKHSGND